MMMMNTKICAGERSNMAGSPLYKSGDGTRMLYTPIYFMEQEVCVLCCPCFSLRVGPRIAFKFGHKGNHLRHQFVGLQGYGFINFGLRP